MSSWARCPPAAAAVPPAAPHAPWHCHREGTQGSRCTHGVAVEHPGGAWASRSTATQSPGVLSPIGCPRMSLPGACPVPGLPTPVGAWSRESRGAGAHGPTHVCIHGGASPMDVHDHGGDSSTGVHVPRGTGPTSVHVHRGAGPTDVHGRTSPMRVCGGAGLTDVHVPGPTCVRVPGGSNPTCVHVPGVPVPRVSVSSLRAPLAGAPRHIPAPHRLLVPLAGPREVGFAPHGVAGKALKGTL